MVEWVYGDQQGSARNDLDTLRFRVWNSKSRHNLSSQVTRSQLEGFSSLLNGPGLVIDNRYLERERERGAARHPTLIPRQLQRVTGEFAMQRAHQTSQNGNWSWNKFAADLISWGKLIKRSSSLSLSLSNRIVAEGRLEFFSSKADMKQTFVPDKDRSERGRLETRLLERRVNFRGSQLGDRRDTLPGHLSLSREARDSSHRGD